jgi:hypothetical protein
MKFTTPVRRALWLALVVAVALGRPWERAAAGELSLEELKSRVTSSPLPDRPPLCIEVSERQLDAATQLYTAGDIEKAQAALGDVVAFSGLARDYAIQSHKREKQSEIAIRKMVRRLDGLKHAVAHDEEKPILESIQKMEQVREDLLTAMFPHGTKK